MKPILSREQIRLLDQHAITACHVPSLVLMENAGRGAADFVESLLVKKPGRVAIVAGPGNNGGDGFVVARRLLLRGHAVRVLFCGKRERLAGDALANHDAWAGVGGAVDVITDAELATLRAELSAADIVVDALFGTGLDREVKGLFASAIEQMDAVRDRVVALDVPSGMDANTGLPLGAVLHARDTVTFAHLKLGLATSTGAERAGRVTVADIGIPGSLYRAVGESARLLERADVASWLSQINYATH
jgi:hydroxyethylthiazole kinase-like uncharacterized protein yjeF